MGCGGSPSLRAEATRELITVKKWRGKMAVGVVRSPTLVLFSAPSRRMAEWVCVFVLIGDEKHAKHGSWLDCNLSSSSGRESRRKSREEVCCVCWAEGVGIERQLPISGISFGTCRYRKSRWQAVWELNCVRASEQYAFVSKRSELRRLSLVSKRILGIWDIVGDL
jgi:hypothetical protein